MGRFPSYPIMGFIDGCLHSYVRLAITSSLWSTTSVLTQNCLVAIPRAGIGRHLPVVLEEDPHTIVTWNIVIYVLDWFYVPSNMLSRLSVVSLYLRIFSKQRTWYFCWAVIVFLVCNCVAFIITANLECIPLRRTWDKSVPGKCFNIELWWKLSNPPNIIADVAILLLPLGKVWKLKATRTKKIGIGFVCLTGSM